MKCISGLETLRFPIFPLRSLCIEELHPSRWWQKLTVEVAKNRSQNCPFWLRASTLIVGALFAHLHSALVRARRLGSHRRASRSRQMPLWQLRSFFAFNFPAWLLRTPSSTMCSLLPSGTAKRNIWRRRKEGLPGLTRFFCCFFFGGGVDQVIKDAKLRRSGQGNFQIITASTYYYQNKGFHVGSKINNKEHKYNLWAYTIEGKVTPSAAFTNSAFLLLVLLGHLSYKNLADPPLSHCSRFKLHMGDVSRAKTNSAATGRHWLWNITQLRRTIQRSCNYANTHNSVILWLRLWLKRRPAVRHSGCDTALPESNRCLCDSLYLLLLCSISHIKSEKLEEVVCLVPF